MAQTDKERELREEIEALQEKLKSVWARLYAIHKTTNSYLEDIGQPRRPSQRIQIIRDIKTFAEAALKEIEK